MIQFIMSKTKQNKTAIATKEIILKSERLSLSFDFFLDSKRPPETTSGFGAKLFAILLIFADFDALGQQLERHAQQRARQQPAPWLFVSAPPSRLAHSRRGVWGGMGAQV